MAALSSGRRQGAAASPGGASVESRDVGEAASAGAGAHPAEIQWRRGVTLRADAGRRAPGERGRADRGPRDAAAMDARRGPVESPAEAAAVSAASGAKNALRGAGAARWQLSSVVRDARAAALPDRHGGRCD